ncbi:hypothetical protein R3P38DRAFT_3301776 [Favolaschia claudopus]|uniref:Metal-dependent protein hydrolase n=1 Tax=Favolaschia claudopus TaxID=2862362 RepID=A0AAW0EFM6_9AGAR
MRLLGALFAAAVVPLAFAQSSSGSAPAQPSAQVTLITSVITSVGLGASRQVTTVLQTTVITSTIQPQNPTSPTGDPNNSNNGNSQSSSAASSTTTANLPTGTAQVISIQAPSPGAPGGAYGPDDNYINFASTLRWSPLLLSGAVVVTSRDLVHIVQNRCITTSFTRLTVSRHVFRCAKKQKLSQSKIIGTHNGTFHCDEALACFLLRQTEADPAILETCDIVVDVGAIYDESKQLFDHHQRGFTEVFGHGFETKLSSAGLVYKHFGKEVIATKTQLPVDDPKVLTLWLKMYKQFIEAIDGIDNGVSQYPSDIKPKYKSSTDLSSRVAALNPVWNQPSSPAIYDAQFAKASQVTGEEFLGKLNYYASAWLPARDLLNGFIASSKQTYTIDRLLVFEQFFPWKEHLFDYEEEHATPESEKTLYVIYPDDGGSWRIQAVPASSESFESRKALPETWRGLRDDTLSAAIGIEGCVFIHASGFIGGNKTKEGALQLAKAALAM